MREKCLISPIIEEFRINIGRFFRLIFIKLKENQKLHLNIDLNL